MEFEYEEAKGIYTFVKFGKIEHLKMLQKGRLHVQMLKKFKDMVEDESGRADNYEGASAVYQTDKINVTFNAVKVPSKELVGTVNVHLDRHLRYYVFCLYALNAGKYYDSKVSLEDYKAFLKLNSKANKLGNHLLLFKNPEAFSEKIKATAKAQGLNVQAQPVKYYDNKKFHGKIPDEFIGFTKPTSFSHQNEYRIVFKDCDWPQETHIFDIGDLSDITEIFTVEQFNNTIEVQAPSD